ncbi:TonB-dependent receptor domain-containing protein [Mannheimia granulomatis]|uniref:TonB-dependent receptor domain-containing protein n=1 Tax=Mannheimia granulomatis TaxID=85402 RepID=UPI00159DE3D7|nr:TonB-dependent receptor [Mannheimia granulomatis]
MKLNIITRVLLPFLSVGLLHNVSAAEEKEIAELDTVTVYGNLENPNFANFTKTGSVSSRATNVNAMQSLDSIVRSVAGGYTQIDPGQGGVSVNIRSMTGLGRVNTMIDGVPQIQLGTSANGGGKFHADGNGPMSQFSTLIDQNFLTRVDISKGHSSGAAGLNALAGSANFKTIDVEDILLDKNKVGMLSRFNYGNNDLGKNGMIALAGKTDVLSSGSLASLFAFSKSSISQNYRRGNGTMATDSAYMQGLKNHPESYMEKIAFKPNQDIEFKLSGRQYKNSLVGRNINSSTYSLESSYRPQSDWIDIKLLTAITKTKQDFHDDAKLWTLEDASTQNKMWMLDLNNTSRFEIGKFATSFTYGMNLMHNKYSRFVPKQTNDDGAIRNAAFGPEGTQNIHSLYLDSEFKYGIATLNAGIHYSRYQLKGYKPECDADDMDYCFPSFAFDVNKKHSAVNPSATLSLQLAEWFQPFVSYKETSRSSNVQEMFNTSRNGLSVNPFLKPEKAKTYEVGFNIHKDNLLLNSDLLGLKVVYFNSQIKDYLYNLSLYGCGTTVCRNANNSTDTTHFQIYVNHHEKVKNRGWEVELAYDSDYFFINGSYTRTESTAPTSKGAAILYGFGTEAYTQLPKDYATLELGTKWLDKKLTLSGTFKYTGKAKRVGIDLDEDGNILHEELPNIPVIIDLYANYKVNKHLTLKAGVQNLMNRNYLDALNAYNSSPSEDYDYDTNTYRFTNSARGRTYTLGAEVRF